MPAEYCPYLHEGRPLLDLRQCPQQRCLAPEVLAQDSSHEGEEAQPPTQTILTTVNTAAGSIVVQEKKKVKDLPSFVWDV
jgi:hypothetical protein